MNARNRMSEPSSHRQTFRLGRQLQVIEAELARREKDARLFTHWSAELQ
jgi:hypothetical protein